MNRTNELCVNSSSAIASRFVSMKLSPWFLFLFAAYVAFLNACNKNGNRRTRNDGRIYNEMDDESGSDEDQKSSELDDDEIDDSIQRKYCKRNTRQLRTGYDDIRNGKFNLSDGDLQDAILTLWEMDEKGRTDGLYETDLQYRLDNRKDLYDKMEGKFFRSLEIEELLQDRERKLLWELFEAYDSLNERRIDTATNNFFDQVMQGDPFKYMIQYLKKRHPTAMNDRQFDQTVKRIWTGKFIRNHVVAKTSAVRHYFIGERRSGRESNRMGLHHYLKLIYLESNDRLTFRNYSWNYQHPRIAKLKYDTVEYWAPRSGVPIQGMLTGFAFASTMIGTTAGFDIALMTLLFYTRPENHCAEFFLGDGTAVQVVVRSSTNYQSKTTPKTKQSKFWKARQPEFPKTTQGKFMGPMFANAIGKR